MPRTRRPSSSRPQTVAPALTPTLTPRVAALLDAQVAFFVDRLDPARLEPLIAAEVDAVLGDARKLRLEAMVSRESVKQVALRYAAEIEAAGAIPELVGETARRLLAAPIQNKTPLSALMSERQLEGWLDKLLELKDLRRVLMHETLSNPVIVALASDLLYRGIRGYLAENAVTRSIPGAQSMMKLGKSVLAKATPRLDNAIENTLRGYVQRSTVATLRESEESLQELLTDEALREATHEIWAQLKTLSPAELRKTLSDDDIEDLFVTGYEHWRGLRKTRWYAAQIETGIDLFFDKYGEATLGELLDDLGITPKMMVEDALRFAPQALGVLRKSGLLEALLRRQLRPFFESAEATALLG